MFFKQKIGLALGGGGARGVAHLGVLRHFEEIGIRPHAVAGTSAGAIVAALYAFGIPLKEIEERLRPLNPAPFSSFKLGELGLFENSDLKKMLTELLPVDARIEQASIPLAIRATDLLSGKGVVLLQGPVVEAILASSCVPGFYLPIWWEEKLLVDGGLTENVPLSPLRILGANVLVGVNLNGNKSYEKPAGIIDVVSNAMDIAIDAQTREQLKSADVNISIDLTSYSRTSNKDFDELLTTGLTVARKRLPSRMHLILWNRLFKLWRFTKEVSPIHIPDKIKEWFKG